VIFEGKVHQSTWYRITGIPNDWTIGLSENDWTNDDLGYKWLVDVFDKYTKNRVVGKYHLLLLDGHKSHFTPEFDQYCKDNSIICLCFPPHSTDRLQPLDIGCFSPLKNAYGRLIL
jgi:hypothetical protein